MKLPSRRTREEQDWNCLRVIQRAAAAVVDSISADLSHSFILMCANMIHN